MRRGAAPHGSATVVGPGLGPRLRCWLGLPLAGAVLGGLLALLLRVAGGGAWLAPLVLAGLTAGLLAAAVVRRRRRRYDVVVVVADDQITFRRGAGSRRVPRSSVDAAFVDASRLVLLGHSAEEVAGVEAGVDVRRLAAAFQAHNYPWLPGGDPYRGFYRRWTPGEPGLPAGVDDLLTARAAALHRGDRRAAARLRGELASRDIVVREERDGQYWRRSRRGTSSVRPPATEPPRPDRSSS